MWVSRRIRRPWSLPAFRMRSTCRLRPSSSTNAALCSPLIGHRPLQPPAASSNVSTSHRRRFQHLPAAASRVSLRFDGPFIIIAQAPARVRRSTYSDCQSRISDQRLYPVRNRGSAARDRAPNPELPASPDASRSEAPASAACAPDLPERGPTMRASSVAIRAAGGSSHSPRAARRILIVDPPAVPPLPRGGPERRVGSARFPWRRARNRASERKAAPLSRSRHARDLRVSVFAKCCETLVGRKPSRFGISAADRLASRAASAVGFVELRT